MWDAIILNENDKHIGRKHFYEKSLELVCCNEERGKRNILGDSYNQGKNL